jgi:hypothetical protein
MSDEILFQDADGNNFIGTCYYQGFMDGEFAVSMIEVTTMFVCSSLGRDTDVIENKKVYSQVTTDKEHKKLMKVYTQKTTNKTNNVKKLLLLLLALTMLSFADHRDTPNLRKRTRLL